MHQRFYCIILLFIMLGFNSCDNKKNVSKSNTLSQDQVTKRLLEANIAAIEVENKQIDKLIDSLRWNMTKTTTGLRYEILEKGNGPKAAFGQMVHFEYEVKLMNGEIIYSSVQTGPKEFKIGSGGVESGLEEGVLLLKKGDKARLVIPSYLAHGLSGDQDRIPPKATLIYTIKLIDLN